MAAQKHLHELLNEDQEPFLLNNYIADRRSLLKRPSPKTHLQFKKRKPISETSTFPTNFCKNACFFSFHDSPDLRKSPLFDFASPTKSPRKSPNGVFLHIPGRTAAMLLEAALRIQKQQSSSKTKTQSKSHGFGLFGSMLKKLTHLNRNRKREIGGDTVRDSAKDILRLDSSVGRKNSFNGSKKVQEKIMGAEMGFSYPSNARPSSAVWSESNEEKSLDLDGLSNSCHSDSEEIGFVSKEKEDDDYSSYENRFCESPFRFVLQTSPTPGRRTPEFLSPVASPIRPVKKEKESIEEEEEEKEQSSPVSVLDPPFEDDDDGRDEEGEDDGYDLESSYAIVHRAKQQLLHKLRRFERLAALDPIELERRMLEDGQDDDIELDEEEASENDIESVLEEIVKEVLSKSSFYNVQKIPKHAKRLLSDLIEEEERGRAAFEDGRALVKRVCERLESWKEVESNTIDMMVEQDFRTELDGWKKNQEPAWEMALEVELAIFGLLVEEVSDDLV